MLPRLLERKIAGRERELGVKLDCLRHIARHAPGEVSRLDLLEPPRLRGRLPAEVFHLARLQVALVEDCRTCVQVELNLARRNGVAPELLRAVISQYLEDLPADLADVVRFAWISAQPGGNGDEVRERLRDRFGEEGMVELALAVATARLLPTLQRSLGYTGSCATVPLSIPA